MADPKKVQVAIEALTALQSEDALVAVAAKAIVANNPELAPLEGLLAGGLKAAIDTVLSPASASLFGRLRKLIGL